MKQSILHILNRRHWNFLIKTVIVLAFGWFLVRRFRAGEDIDMVWMMFVDEWQSGSPWIILVVVLMMPLNWMMEILKWKLLMRPAMHLSWRRATAGVLSGITFSLFTPNRIGEYGGRILYVDPKYTWHAVMASLTGSFAQNLIHISFGLIAGLMLIGVTFHLPQNTITGIWILAACGIVFCWLAYLNLPYLTKLLSTWKPPRILTKPWRALEHIAMMTRRQLSLALLFALLRYAIFSMQYVLLLSYFGADVPWIWLAGGVAVIYLMHTSIPLPPFVDLIARNELGILLWTGFGVNELSVMAAGFSIWILNLAVPALCGLLTIAAVNILRSIGYESEKLPSSSAQRADRVLDRTRQ